MSNTKNESIDSTKLSKDELKNVSGGAKKSGDETTTIASQCPACGQLKFSPKVIDDVRYKICSACGYKKKL